MIRAIVFDWSGTLVDDLPAVWKATNYVLSQAGKEAMTLDQFRAEFCLPFTAFYDRHVPQVPLSELEGWFHSHFVTVRDSVIELPHARAFLEFCNNRGIRMFLLSTVHPDHYAAQVKVTGFDVFLEKAYVGVWDKRKKIGEIVADHGLKTEESLFIGDMQHDIETAKHGGLHSCAVLTGYNTLAQLRASEPDCIVEHLGELRELLETDAFPTQKGTAVSAHRLQPVVTVGALVSDAAGRVLMVRTHKWSNKWGIPGGKIKWGESSEAALRREIKEETNLDIETIEFVLVQDCIHSPEFYRESHFILLNYRCRAAGDPNVILNDEAREYRWVSIVEALEMDINQPTRILLQAVAAGAPAHS
jgi:ADP-ribose pyrophosphatase YjhB (NUDIX family)/phosphoglycolate phosphatase-like HAD superfamily hydrolase